MIKVKNDDDQLKELLELSNLSEVLDKLNTPEIEGKEEVWKNLKSKISIKRKQKGTRVMVRVAASIALLIGLSYSIYNTYTNHQYITIETAELTAPKEVILPDSTRVILNSYSTLSYPKVFENDIREVSFEGLAYFSVTKDKNRPFIISAPKSEVKVLGTSFSVRAYKKEANEEIFLEEGSVALSYKKNEVLLVPGELATVNPSAKKISKIVNLNKNINAWKTRELIFDNDPLSYVFSELERYYGKSIIVDNHNILDLSFKGHYKDASIEGILEVLTYTLNLEYIINNNNILLTNKS